MNEKISIRLCKQLSKDVRENNTFKLYYLNLNKLITNCHN